jgi:hypothetical protein
MTKSQKIIQKTSAPPNFGTIFKLLDNKVQPHFIHREALLEISAPQSRQLIKDILKDHLINKK